MSKRLSDLLASLEARAPARTAEDWDNVGLMAGDPAWRVQGAVVSIDLTAEAIAQAEKKNFRLIVTHHPPIFPKSKGYTRVTQQAENALPSLIFSCLQKKIAVASYHTNFDRCALEVVENLSQKLGITPLGRLHDQLTGELTKLVVFVPATHLDQVRSAVSEAGAGHVGNYDCCTFASPGEGTFRGNIQTQPFLGKPGILERANEVRLETVFPKGLSDQVLKALKAAHPYEEMAYDLYSVEQPVSTKGVVRGLGYGFWGDFSRPKSFSTLAQDVKNLFTIKGFLVNEAIPTRVRRIAFVAGKGSSFIKAASDARCDVLITGEVGYHGSLEATRRGLAVMEIGHRESERFFLSTMRDWIKHEGVGAVMLDRPTQKLMWLGEMQ